MTSANENTLDELSQKLFESNRCSFHHDPKGVEHCIELNKQLIQQYVDSALAAQAEKIKHLQWCLENQRNLTDSIFMRSGI